MYQQPGQNYNNYQNNNYDPSAHNQAQFQQVPQKNKQSVIHKAKSFDETDENGDKLEIIRQGYGVFEGMKIDILDLYKQSSHQQEYKNPADFIKHKLDAKYGPYWFIFMWEDMPHQQAQYSYYNNDDKVFEFQLNGWHVLVYSFNQSQQQKEFVPQPQQQQQQPIRQQNPYYHSQYSPQQSQSYPQQQQQQQQYQQYILNINSQQPPPLPPPFFDQYSEEYDDPYRVDPRYPYPSMQIYRQPPQGQRRQYYY